MFGILSFHQQRYLKISLFLHTKGRLYVICTTIRKMTLNVNSNKFRVEIEREYFIQFHTGSTEDNCFFLIALTDRF
jgi:hypothetical protein